MQSGDTLSLALRGHKLANKDFFSKSDPYIVISKPVNGGWNPIRRSESIKVRNITQKNKTSNLTALLGRSQSNLETFPDLCSGASWRVGQNKVKFDLLLTTTVTAMKHLLGLRCLMMTGKTTETNLLALGSSH